MQLVVIESPYAGNIRRHLAYARAAMQDCIHRNEAPFASHLLYTQPGVLDDETHHERELGIAAGLFWGAVADKIVVYQDLGITPGMIRGIEAAMERGQLVEYRNLPAGTDGWSNR